MTTLITDIIRDRAERGLSDLLLTVADHFYCLGAGIGHAPIVAAGLADLLATIEARYQAEIMAARGWADPPLTNDELPGWLLAHCERQTALGDAVPPESWLTRAANEGKP